MVSPQVGQVWVWLWRDSTSLAMIVTVLSSAEVIFAKEIFAL
jgi:hypothetical protein